MTHRDSREHDERIRALQRDAEAVVPEQTERDLLSAFRAHHALAILRGDDGASVPPRLEARLLTAFREHHAAEWGSARAVRWFTWYAPRAAVLIGAVAAATWFALAQPPHRAEAPRAEIAQTAPKPPVVGQIQSPGKRHVTETRSAAATEPSVVTPAVRLPLPGRAIAAAKGGASAPTIDEDDRGGEFMPLLNADLSPGEPTHIVSLDVPRSALLDFGAEAEADVAADVTADDAAAVHAEVLMSEDGMPRGIRFVDRAPAPLGGSSGSRRAPLPLRRRLQP